MDMGRESTRISFNSILDQAAPKEIDGIPTEWILDFTSKEIAVVLHYKGMRIPILRSRNNPIDQVVKACVEECVRKARGPELPERSV
jgi:hypothetical protein